MIHHITYPRSGCQLLIWCLLKFGSENPYYPFEIWDDEEYKFFVKRRKSINQILREEFPGQVIHSTKHLIYADLHDEPSGGFKPNPNFLHFHDISYKLPKPDKYIFQFRHPILCAISYIGWGINDEAYYQPEFIEYFYKQIDQWKQWVKKWIIDKDYENAYFLEYNDFMQNPKHKLIEIIKFLELPYNQKLIDGIINTMNIKYKHNFFKDFDICRVYDKDLEKLEKTIKKELNLLNIPLLFKENYD